MKCIIRDDYEKMSEVTAQIVLGTMYQDKRANLSITAGSSPVGTYQVLIPILRENPNDFRHVHFYSFDNMALDNNKDGITGKALRDQFFSPAAVQEKNIHLINEDNHISFMTDIDSAGGLDLMLIGLGADGHFCGNMPGLSEFHLESYTYPFCENFGDDPQAVKMFGESKIADLAVTMGAAALMKTKRLILIVNGKSKAAAVKKFMESGVDEMFPVSVLKLHPNFTVILDADAASAL